MVCGYTMLTANGLMLAILLMPASITDYAITMFEDTRDERYMLHRRLRLDNVRIWDTNANNWRLPLGSEVINTPKVSVLHFWAHYCQPCLREFPLFAAMSKTMSSNSVQFVFISETQGDKEMRDFVTKNKALMPDAPWWQDIDGKIMQTLHYKKLPVTLIVDSKYIVRDAYVGTIESRRNQLVESIENLERATTD